eukprot:6366937-Prorocentrum_lima.AAC.1
MYDTSMKNSSPVVSLGSGIKATSQGFASHAFSHEIIEELLLFGVAGHRYSVVEKGAAKHS